MPPKSQRWLSSQNGLMDLTQTTCGGLWSFIKSVCTKGERVKQMHTQWVQGGKGFTFNLLYLHMKVVLAYFVVFGVNFITVL